MEIEALKEAWKAYSINKEHKHHFDTEDIEKAFRVKIIEGVQRINKKMMIDAFLMTLTIGILMMITTLWLALRSAPLVIVSLGVLYLILMVHYRIKYKVINRSVDFKHGVLTSITDLLRKILWYMKIYQVIIPILSLGLYIIFAFYRDLLSGHGFQYGVSFWIKVIFVIPVLWLSHRFTQWLIFKIYGQEIKQLKTLKKEIIDEVTGH